MWKQVTGWFLTAIIVVAMIYMNFRDSDTRFVTEKAKNGVLDLRTLSKDTQLLSLSGDWKFTPNNFIDPQFFRKESKNQLVPKGWNVDAQYGSYQLKIHLPDHLSEVGFRVRNIWSAHTIYINGKKVSEIGKIGTSKHDTTPNNPAYEFYIKPNTPELLVTIHVANFYNARGGIIYPIDLGDAKVIQENVQKATNLEWTAIFILLIFSIFHLTIFLLRKKDDGFFYSGSFFFILTLMVITKGERILLRVIPDIPFDFYFRLQDFATFCSSLLLLTFVVKIMPSLMSKKQMIVLFSPLIFYTIAMVVSPARSLSNLQYPFFFYINILLFGTMMRMIWLMLKKRWSIPKNEIIILNLMLLFLFIFSFSGALDQFFLSGRNLFNRLGFLGFIIIMNVFLGIRLINRTEEAEQLNERLEKANVAKDAFLEVTTQELKNPLYHAINLTKSIQIHNQNKQLHIIEQLMERLLYLISDLQDFTRIRFQDYSFDVHSTNVRMVVCHIEKLMEFSFSRKNIVFQEFIPHTLHVLADENRLAQIFYRIIEECSNYATNGEIIVQAQHINKEVYLTFKATGEHAPLFVEPSNDIGLMMGEELLQRMNGHLHIEHSENSILFTVELPFYEYKKLSSSLKEQEDSWPALSLEMKHKQKILIVEDDVIHAEVLESLLSEQYMVTITYSAQEAISILEHTDEFSLIIIDEVMPGMDGIELTKRIRHKTSLLELPIIMMTSNDYPTNVETIFAAGANDYLVKPMTRQAISARLNAVEQTKCAMTRAIENEMAFLQAQIKPHFLYNALSSIISFCYTDGERAAHLLTMLSYYLRYILESGKEEIFSPLQKELSIIDAYVEIEKARFGERLSFSYHIDPSLQLQQIRIPSLLIQPLVENAVRHGLFEKEGDGHVQLIIKRIENSLFIQVVDDGVGMSKEKQNTLLDGTMKLNGIGFPNVLRRVREISNGNLTIHSIEGEGTTMSVTIPLKEDNHVENNSH